MIYALLAVLIALNIGDILTTLAVIRKGGTEYNPVGRYLMDRIGVLPAMILLKGVAILLAIALVLFFPAYWWVLLILCVMPIFAILYNLESI